MRTSQTNLKVVNTSAKTRRNRCSSISIPEPTYPVRPVGRLNDEEIEELRLAYASGANGEVLIGMRRLTRLVPLYFPAQTDVYAAALLMQRSAERLKSYGADGYIFVRRAKLRSDSLRQRVSALVVDERIESEESQTVILLDDPKRRWRLQKNLMEDAVSRVLRAGLGVAQD